MSEAEIWLSEDEDEDGEDTEGLGSADPLLFQLALTDRGQSGDFHVRNKPNQRQRPAVAVFHGGSKKKPTFTVSCNAKAMIHGEMGGSSDKHATLLVYEFKFNSYRGTRIKEATIMFEFHPKDGQTGGPSVVKVRPHGLHTMEKTTQQEASKTGMEVNIGPSTPLVSAAFKLSGEQSAEKVTKDHTAISGDNPQSDDWGNYYQARFFLAENKTRKTGIPSHFTACILLERDDNLDFVCLPYVEAVPNLKTMVMSLFSSRSADDWILFSMNEAPFDKLEGKVSIDRKALGATNLDMLWDCTMYYNYEGATKPSRRDAPGQ